jgi:hypothetical protein
VPAMRRGNQKPNAKSRRGGARGDRAISHPPQIASYGITHSTKLRFVTNAAVAQTNITFENLLDLILVGTSLTTASDLFQQVRVRSVEMWAVPVVGGATTVQCEFRDQTVGFAGDAKIHSDTSMGVQPAHLRAKPAARSGFALFQFSQATSAFTLTCPGGTVVDVELTFRGLPNLNVAAQQASVGTTTGAWYYRGLDGLAKAATVFFPVIDAASVI